MKVVEIHCNSGLVTIQWITENVGILRYHGKENKKFGSPFSFSLTMLRDGIKATFFAASDTYTREVHRSVRDAMWAIGITSVHYDRRKSEILHKTLIK